MEALGVCWGARVAVISCCRAGWLSRASINKTSRRNAAVKTIAGIFFCTGTLANLGVDCRRAGLRSGAEGGAHPVATLRRRVPRMVLDCPSPPSRVQALEGDDGTAFDQSLSPVEYGLIAQPKAKTGSCAPWQRASSPDSAEARDGPKLGLQAPGRLGSAACEPRRRRRARPETASAWLDEQ
jgi:hypothetical protein